MPNPLAKFQPIHGVINNAPAIMVAMATDGLCAIRCFYNIGAPSSSTLVAGNAKYNGFYNGFVIAATLTAAGTGYAVADVLTTGTTGGTATTATIITVDAVTSAGAIVDFHISTAGVYSVYPTNPVSVTGGAGTGATFTLNQPPADFYFDMTTPSAPVQYMCITAGSKSTSTWAKVSGAPTNPVIEVYNNTHAYPVGSIAFVDSATTVGGITILPGVYATINGVPVNGTANQIPQFPLPVSGLVYWRLIALGINTLSTCDGNKYANLSA